MGALAEHHGLIKAPVVNRQLTPTAPAQESIDMNALPAPGQTQDTNRMMQ